LCSFFRFSKNSEKGLIEVAPLAYMRGRTLDNAFIILDEAQNTTPAQMKMFLTRKSQLLTSLNCRTRQNNTADLLLFYTISMSFSEKSSDVLEIDKEIICRTISGKPVKG